MPNPDRSIAAVAFDMDGLMFNTEDIYDTVGKRMLQRRQQEFTIELKTAMMGLPAEKALTKMKEHCGLADDLNDLLAESSELFEAELPQRIELLPGVSDLIVELERRELPKAVATSSHRCHAERALGTFGLEPRFSFVLTAESVQNGKPAPDIYLLAAERFGIEVSQLLVLEDSVIGSSAAAAAGAVTVAVPGSHSRGLDFNHADYVVDRLDSDVILMLLDR